MYHSAGRIKSGYIEQAAWWLEELRTARCLSRDGFRSAPYIVIGHTAADHDIEYSGTSGASGHSGVDHQIWCKIIKHTLQSKSGIHFTYATLHSNDLASGHLSVIDDETSFFGFNYLGDMWQQQIKFFLHCHYYRYLHK